MMAKGASNCLFLSLLFLLVIYSSAEVAEFTAKVEKPLENSIVREEKQIFLSSRRQLLDNVKKTAQHDMIFPPLNPTPTVVTVPSTLPVNTPAPIPTTTPITVPSTNPNNPTVTITNPATSPVPIAVPGGGAGAQQPVTNPVTTYPAPMGSIPVSTPVTNPLPPPATTSAPAVQGQSWCVARTGVPETSLQSALDYACGMGGADCSQIQQGANCYNPNTMQNHASYAFNSYYQKNRSPTSCDFGGAATIVNTNPSSGSCIFPSSASQSTPVAQPATVATPATTSSTLPGTGIPGSVTPPSVLNSGNPDTGSATTSIFGPEMPPNVNTSTSMSVGLQPSFSCVIVLTMTAFVAGFILESSIFN